MKDSTLTVLIPCFENPSSLYRALVSLSHQTIANSLIVLISDDSPSNPIGKGITTYFLDCFASLIYHQQTRNLGIVQNKKWLYSQCRTKYFAFLEHDDVVLDSDFYDRAVFALEESDSLSAYLGNSYIYRPAEKQQPKQCISFEALARINESWLCNYSGMYNIDTLRVKCCSALTIAGPILVNLLLGLDNFCNFNTSWSAIIIKKSSMDKVGGFAGQYQLSAYEANTLNIYADEEHFGFLIMLAINGNFRLSDRISCVRMIESHNWSLSPLNSARKFRIDPLYFVYYKWAWIVSMLEPTHQNGSISGILYAKIQKMRCPVLSKNAYVFIRSYQKVDLGPPLDPATFLATYSRKEELTSIVRYIYYKNKTLHWLINITRNICNTKKISDYISHFRAFTQSK